MHDGSRSEAVALLAWYREMGADAVVADAPVDWMSRPDTPPGAGHLARVVASIGAAAEASGATAAVDGAPSSKSALPTGHAPGRPPLTRATRGISAEPATDRPPPARPADRPPPARQAPSAAALAPPAAPRQFPTAAPDAAEQAARSAAASAASLDALRAALDRFEGCALKATAKSLCFFRGATSARLMIVGEAPGREEDLEGKPFVGRAGKLLDKMLAAIQLGEPEVHITNVVYWRPPGNRTPTTQETVVCRPFLLRQIELVAPDVLLLLGGPAMKAMLDLPDGIMKVRGKWRVIEIGGRSIKVMPTLHPAYLLRTPAAKRQAWQDLLAVRLALGEVRPPADA